MSAALTDDAAERYVLGAIALYPGALYDVREVMQPEDFADVRHVALWHAVVAVDAMPEGRHGDGSIATIDPALLRAELVRAKVHNATSGPRYLVERCIGCEDLDGMPPTPRGAIAAAQRVADLARRRRVLEAAAEMRALAVEADTGAEAVSGAVSAMQRVAAVSARGDAGRGFGEALGLILSRDRTAPTRWPLPWPALDAALGGLRPGRLVVIAARPAVGKSAVSLNLALALSSPATWYRYDRERAATKPVPVLYFSLEMPESELVARGAGAMIRASGRDIEDGQAFGTRFDELVGLAHATATAPLRIDCSTMKVAAMRDRAVEFFRRHGPGVVVIDYLQLASPAGLDLEKQASRERAVAAMSRECKVLAMQSGCCVVLLSQLNRSVDDTERPSLSHLRESGAVEQDADAVVFLFGPKPEAQSITRDVTAYVAKCRGGAAEVDVPLTLHRAHTLFVEAPGAANGLPIDDPRTGGGEWDSPSDEGGEPWQE